MPYIHGQNPPTGARVGVLRYCSVSSGDIAQLAYQTSQVARPKISYSYLGAEIPRHPQTFPDVTSGNFPSPFQRLSRFYDGLDSIYPLKNSALDTNHPTFQGTFIPWRCAFVGYPITLTGPLYEEGERGPYIPHDVMLFIYGLQTTHTPIVLRGVFLGISWWDIRVPYMKRVRGVLIGSFRYPCCLCFFIHQHT